MDTRADWLAQLERMARPVLDALASGQLRARMPVEKAPGCNLPREEVSHLEALGRTLVGIAPWLELEADLPAAEATLQQEFREKARQCITNAVDLESADYLDFAGNQQALVDAAFLCQAILRAPKQLWGLLDATTRERLITEVMTTRQIKAFDTNWLLFASTVECFLCLAEADWKPEPIERAFSRHEDFYLGEGMYGDGPKFHWDYYNSYVIQPMLLDNVDLLNRSCDTRIPQDWKDKWPIVLNRAQRYAVMQEQIIGPDGTFPLTGRSMTYRTGAFQVLADVSWRNALPEHLPYGQARHALSLVINRLLDAPGTYDENDWLQLGVVGHQPHTAQTYISTGSLYLASTIFLPLGLAPDHPFWADALIPTTAQRLWASEDFQPYVESKL